MKRKIKYYLRKMKTRTGQISIRLLIIIGLILLTISLFWHIARYFSPQTKASEKNQLYSQAKQISIPSININTLIAQGGIENGSWILSDDSVLVLPASGKPGEGFNTIIYAHNRPALFSDLEKIKLGDQIFIKNQKGRQFVYKVFSFEYIKPEDLNKIRSDIPDTLTLFTCDGPFDQARLIVKALMISPLAKKP